MIAHVVFDLPLDGPFDYLVPEPLSAHVKPGIRVKVHLGTRALTGFVVSLADSTQVKKLRSIRKVVDLQVIFDGRDLEFAGIFANYYACTLGEALGVMLRHRRKGPQEYPPANDPKTSLYHCPDGEYAHVIDRLTAQRTDYRIIVPDAFVANAVIKGPQRRSMTGLRTSMFEAFIHARLLIVIDEDSASYKQEQSPMYETRQIVLMAQKIYGFDVAFVSTVPSVELMHLAKTKDLEYVLSQTKALSKPGIIDLENYKFIEKGLLSPPVRHALQENLKAKRTTLILLNRRGTFRVTRCSACGYILKCQRCDSAMGFVRSLKQFVCQICSFRLADAGNCPKCHVPSWKSFGMGVEQLHKEIAMLFPEAKVSSFESGTEVLTPAFDILIATQAILRFKHQVHTHTVVVVDLDAELVRANMRTSFKAWSLVSHLRCMGTNILLQTRNREHHVLKALALDDARMFYARELELRRELGFAPFYHWAAIIVRSRIEKSAQVFAQDVYNEISQIKAPQMSLNPVAPDAPAKVRDQFRFCVMLGASSVEPIVACIKSALSSLKRRSKTIVTINIDP